MYVVSDTQFIDIYGVRSAMANQIETIVSSTNQIAFIVCSTNEIATL